MSKKINYILSTINHTDWNVYGEFSHWKYIHQSIDSMFAKLPISSKDHYIPSGYSFSQQTTSTKKAIKILESIRSKLAETNPTVATEVFETVFNAVTFQSDLTKITNDAKALAYMEERNIELWICYGTFEEPKSRMQETIALAYLVGDAQDLVFFKLTYL